MSCGIKVRNIVGQAPCASLRQIKLKDGQIFHSGPIFSTLYVYLFWKHFLNSIQIKLWTIISVWRKYYYMNSYIVFKWLFILLRFKWYCNKSFNNNYCWNTAKSINGVSNLYYYVSLYYGIERCGKQKQSWMFVLYIYIARSGDPKYKVKTIILFLQCGYITWYTTKTTCIYIVHKIAFVMQISVHNYTSIIMSNL